MNMCTVLEWELQLPETSVIQNAPNQKTITLGNKLENNCEKLNVEVPSMNLKD